MLPRPIRLTLGLTCLSASLVLASGCDSTPSASPPPTETAPAASNYPPGPNAKPTKTIPPK
jgi:hypothetical protein